MENELIEMQFIICFLLKREEQKNTRWNRIDGDFNWNTLNNKWITFNLRSTTTIKKMWYIFSFTSSSCAAINEIIWSTNLYCIHNRVAPRLRRFSIVLLNFGIQYSFIKIHSPARSIKIAFFEHLNCEKVPFVSPSLPFVSGRYFNHHLIGMETVSDCAIN